MNKSRISRIAPLLIVFLVFTFSFCSEESSLILPQNEPNNFAIAFHRNNGNQGSTISTINPDGTNEKNFSSSKLGQNQFPAWSPDGEKIAFVSDRYGGPDVFIMNKDGSNPVQITNTGGMKFSLSWSPLNNRLLFIGFEDNAMNVFTSSTNADYPDIHQLTEIPANNYSPLWSKDGNAILFQTLTDSSITISHGPYMYFFGYTTISVIQSDGSGLTEITNTPEIITSLSWSPNGTQIAYSSISQITVDSSFNFLLIEKRGDIYTVNANDGSNKTKITNNEFFQNIENAEFSPDGSKILAVRTKFETSELLIMNADGSNQRVIGRRDFKVDRALWSPDGKRIIYTGTQRHRTNVFIIGADGSNPRKLTNSSGGMGGLKVSSIFRKE